MFMGIISMRRVACLVSMVAALIAGALYATADLQRNAAMLGASQQAASGNLLTAVLDQETGSRGFFETRDKAFLQPWDEGATGFASSLASLRSLVAGNAVLEQMLDRQAELAGRWQAASQAAITLLGQAGRVPTDAEALGQKALMDDFRVAHVEFDASLARQRDQRLAIATRVAVAVALALAAMLVGIGLLARRLVRREEAHQRAQAQLRELLQACDSEHESRDLLIRHVERLLPQADAVMLNRYTTDDPLEITRRANADESGLAIADTDALRPRSCMAIRFSRPYDRHPGDDGLQRCEICGDLPRSSACEPLLVGGRVIGSVLVTSPKPINHARRQRLRESVAEAAPILANQRNLTLAELRAVRDRLTGLPNRRAADETLKRMAAQANRSSAPLAAIMIDIDHFKGLNDRYGHEAGDKALILVAQIIKSTLRSSDFAARFGGEEFLVLLPDTDRPAAMLVAEKLRTEIGHAELAAIDRMSASLGLAMMPEDATAVDELVRNADEALYSAKQTGRNRVRAFSRRQPDPVVLPPATT
jgi:diguanylate cyclase (GGDEF)-like protein